MSPSPLTETSSAPSWQDWRWQLQHALSAPAEIARVLNLAPDELRRMEQVAARYPIRVPPYYLSLARSSTLADPILRQCLPSLDEISVAGGSADPLAEDAYCPAPRIVHRYRDRALLLAGHDCAMRCRHCLRKRIWRDGPRPMAARDELQQGLDYIQQTPQLREILLSGGDPLLLPEAVLDWLLAELHRIPHIEIVRIGTRLPVVLPQRFGRDFCDMLGRHGPTWVATHFNHPAECTIEASQACERLLRAAVPVVNQAVLLRGVNDSADTIRELGCRLLRMRVKPYYLFHGDPATGAMHFRTGIDCGLDILRDLQGHTSGLALPTYALDLPDGGGKIPLAPDRTLPPCPDGTARFRGYDGDAHCYFDGRQN